MLWEDTPSYYDPPQGVLVFSAALPESLLHPPGGMDSKGHVALMVEQLHAIRAALMLAQVLTT